MSVKARVQRLQARLAGACPECRHKPQATYPYYPDEGEPRPEPPTCSSCGRSLGVVLRVVYDDGEGEGLS
jgi:hypothetical protein